ncbi:putative toxin-antitoxin system toxin component, PIN family [Patescibacteria group bacterium]|nr:putative toxin-antitoxin system toxin component, PIN family [Patescibacteria group bacterium]MBU4056360.1 putative toxin-antitoxin system toxin component, PIN family [Patescibacteria group bacterium]MBU4368133.1 putative toxin-antitoxin system toxin component, PIN family [Patescibacteria group bacterium]
MKNTQKLFKVFLDTSVLLSGLNSPFGASAFIITLFKLKKIIIVISPEVIFEAERAIKTKFPLLEITFFDFLTIKPLITPRLTPKEIKSAYNIINSEDTPILAGAIKAKVNFLITLDKKFQVLVKDKVRFEVLSPAEFLRNFREQI